MQADYTRVLHQLEGVIERGNGRWYARCPAHDDKSPSLSVAVADDGRLLLHCFAGCDPESILSALGLGWADLYPNKDEAAYRAATAVRGKHSFDPLELERMVLKIAAEDLRAGKELTVEDRARVQVARLRLAAGRKEVA